MKRPTFLVLGADLTNPNRGVQALARCALSLLWEANPSADLVMQGYHGRHEQVPFGDDILKVRTSNPWVVTGMEAARHSIRRLFGSKASLEDWSSVDVVLDVSGGDLFTTIYGPTVFDRQCRVKEAVLDMGIPLVLLPQTFGPFQGEQAQARARSIIERASLVATREEHGVAEIRRTLGLSKAVHIETVPDMAMTLEPRKPATKRLAGIGHALQDMARLRVGLNVSGLLYFGDEDPERTLDSVEPAHYRSILSQLVLHLVREYGARVCLTPHVMDKHGSNTGANSDSSACVALRSAVSDRCDADAVALVDDGLDCQEIKWVIGQMDMFVGSRMHSCVAACTQGIPTIDLAYSKKAVGVMEMLGRREWVADLCGAEPSSIIELADRLMVSRADERERLLGVMPSLRPRLRKYFRAVLKSHEQIAR